MTNNKRAFMNNLYQVVLYESETYINKKLIFYFTFPGFLHNDYCFEKSITVEKSFRNILNQTEIRDKHLSLKVVIIIAFNLQIISFYKLPKHC